MSHPTRKALSELRNAQPVIKGGCAPFATLGMALTVAAYMAIKALGY